MVRYENDCVDCGQPCIRNACLNYNVPHYYCDECGDEDELYEYEDYQLCKECLLKIVPKVQAD